MGEQQFRSAMGGFNKQDVLDYIERSSREHGEKLEQLRRELAEEKAARADAEERVGQLTENLKACAESLVAARGQVEKREAALAEAEKRAAALAEQVERLTPAAQAYETVKQKMARLEQDPLQRGGPSGVGASRKAEVTCMQLERWVRRVQAGYDRLRTDVDSSMAHASGELERIRRDLDGVAVEFAENDTTLEELVRIVRDAESPKTPPRPLDLDGQG